MSDSQPLYFQTRVPSEAFRPRFTARQSKEGPRERGERRPCSWRGGRSLRSGGDSKSSEHYFRSQLQLTYCTFTIMQRETWAVLATHPGPWREASLVWRKRPAASCTHLVVFAIRVAAAVVGQDAALAIEDVARVTLAALYAVVITVTLQADGGTAGLADAHAALIMAVGGAGDRCNRRD